MSTATRRHGQVGDAANAARQRAFRERRKVDGWRRVGLWLPPEHAAMLETLGYEWLANTVLELLDKQARGKPKQATLFSATGPAISLPGNHLVALWQEADSLHKAGLSWAEIARLWNEQGRRTDKGAEFRGGNIAREVRKWKEGG